MTETEQDTLTTPEAARLGVLEQTIKAGLQTFQEVGLALTEIRDSKLYRATHTKFELYLQERWNITPQHAGRLIHAAEVAQVLEPIGYVPANEHQARQARDTARIIQALEPEQVEVVARFVQAAAGSEQPSPAQIKAVAEVVRDIDESATVEHPDTGEQVPFTTLPPAAQAAVIRENVSTSTHERMERQKTHIATAQSQQQATGGKSWSDWCLNYAKEQPRHVLTITVQADPSGNPQAVATIHDKETGEQLATGEGAAYLKKTVLNLIEEVKHA